MEQGKFSVALRDGVLVVEVRGDVDFTNVAGFQKAIKEAAALDTGLIIASLLELDYLDSRMVHELFTVASRLSQNRQRLIVVWPQSRSARFIIDTAGVPAVAEFYNSVDEAVRAAKSHVRQA